MTDTSSAPTEPGGPIDRRWFEEALRSQGFVAEPPDDGADGSEQTADEEATDQQDGTGARTAPTTTDERPPVPSALLARIASKGQAPATTSIPSAPAVGEAPTRTETPETPGTRPTTPAADTTSAAPVSPAFARARAPIRTRPGPRAHPARPRGGAGHHSGAPDRAAAQRPLPAGG